MGGTVRQLGPVKDSSFDENSGHLDRDFSSGEAAPRPSVAQLELVHRDVVLAGGQLTKRAEERVRIEEVGQIELALKQ